MNIWKQTYIAWLTVSNIFLLSTSNDMLDVYYGNNTALGRQFGVSHPNLTGDVYYSIYNEMFITFTADESISAAGFNISYRIGMYIPWHWRIAVFASMWWNHKTIYMIQFCSEKERFSSQRIWSYVPMYQSSNVHQWNHVNRRRAHYAAFSLLVWKQFRLSMAY